jgi:competence protein ComEA
VKKFVTYAKRSVICVAVAVAAAGYFYGPAETVEYIASAVTAVGEAAEAPVCAPAAAPLPAGRQEANSTITGLVNLNTASAAELDALPGIGKVTAEQIMAARPIASLDQVKALPGVKANNFLKFRDRVTV